MLICRIFVAAGCAILPSAAAHATPAQGLFESLLEDLGLSGIDLDGFDVDGAVIAGIGTAPDYEGSDNYQLGPVIAGRFTINGARLTLAGLGARLDIAPWLADGQRWFFGPAIQVKAGRGDNVADDRVAALPRIGSALEVGGFVGYRWSGLLREDDGLRLSAKIDHDIGGVHNGLGISLGGVYSFRPVETAQIELSLGTDWASADKTATYFAITADAAAASGLAPFDAGAGIKNVTAAMTAGMLLSEQWGIVVRIGGRRLLGDPADSPVVRTAGSRTAIEAGVALGYRF